MTENNNELSINSLKLAFERRRMRLAINFYDSVDSTNNRAKSDFDESGEYGITVAAKQTGGKGRNGRRFESPVGGGYFTLTFSLGSETDISQLCGSVMTAGLAVCDIMEDYGIDCALKWPNDVMARGKKLCGILSEVVYDGDTPDYMLVGIGVNINSNDFNGVNTAVSMQELSGETFNIAEVIANIVRRFFECVKSTSFDVVSEYRHKCTTLGRLVTVTQSNGSFNAFAEDIDEQGFLIVRTADGNRKTVNYGDVSLHEVLS